MIAVGLGGCFTAIARCAGVADEGSGARIERRALAMGTRLETVVEAADRQRAVAASEAALEAVADTERRLSTWRDDSELARLNGAPVATWVPLSLATAHELADALRWATITGGAFDPTVGALVRAWDLRGAGRVPDEGELEAVRRGVGPAGLELGPHGGRRLVDDMTVEEGGFGKGAGLRAAVAAARTAGADCVRVDLGGQWAGDGSCAPVPMSIGHPADRGTPVATFDWTAGSVATSGHSERRVTADGVTFSHLLDPRTGWPAEDRGSVTVLAADPLAADAVATALAVMGAEEGVRWLEGHREFEAVFATTDSRGVVRLVATPAVGGMIRPQDGVLVEVVAYGRVAARGESGARRGSQGAMR